jgi:hypothetical protein
MDMSEKITWTDDMKEAVRKHWADGRTTPDIAEAINADFGTSLTKSAIGGLITRMGYEKACEMEALTSKLVQQEIDAACAKYAAKSADVIFRLRYKENEEPRVVAARAEAIAQIVNRTGASIKIIAKAWGCNDDFISAHYPRWNITNGR